MRRSVLLCSLLGTLALTSCSSTNPTGDPEGPIGTADSAIAYGTADSTHTAVVALLANAGAGELSECSGTIVQVKNGQGYVLTAAHCCNNTVPSVVIVASDYANYEGALGGNPQPPAYAVTAGSVYFDSQYDPNTMTAEGPTYDFCMLKFAAPAGTAVIPVATPSDGLTLGEQIEHVGFGITDGSSTNSGRRTGTAPVDQRLDTWTLKSTQGGSAHIKGVCEGDSGGPSLVPAGAPQSQQKVVATTSYGDQSSCADNTYNVCMRVTSETGPGGFITNFLADTPSGTAGGTAPPADCMTCEQTAENGACATQTAACVADPKCKALSTCLGGCSTAACQTACETTAGTTAVGELNAIGTCVCTPSACATACASDCGTSTASCGGLTTMNPTCDACLTGSCCAQATACAADTACVPCLTATPVCTNDAAATALNDCLNTDCATACGGSSSSSSSGTASGTTGSSSSGKGATSSGGTGASGTTGTGTGVGGGGTGASTASEGSGASGTGGSNNKSGGCSVSAGENSDPGSSASLAGILLGAALAFSRRRRS